MNLVQVSLVSFVIALAGCLLLESFAVRLNLIDHPGERKLQKVAVPRAGGSAVLGAFIISLFLAKAEILNLGILGAAIVYAGGFYDDRKPSNTVREKIIFQLLGVLMAAAYFFSAGVAPIFIFLAAGFIFSMINSFNLMDNMNGLTAGMSVLILISFLSVGLIGEVEALALSAALLGFLLRNFPRGKIFLGDQGSQFLGYWLSFIACRGLLTGTHIGDGRFFIFGSLLGLLVNFAPFIIDTLSVIVIRLKNGAPISKGDQNHLSHQLIKLGFSTVTAPIFLITVQAVFSITWCLLAWRLRGSI